MVFMQNTLARDSLGTRRVFVRVETFHLFPLAQASRYHYETISSLSDVISQPGSTSHM